MNDESVVRREVVLPAPREAVWEALTEAEQLSAWFEAEVEIDPRPRGAVVARDPDGTVRAGAVLAANPPYRLVMVLDGDDGATRIEFTLEAVAEGARLTVIETPVTGPSAGRFLLESVR